MRSANRSADRRPDRVVWDDRKWEYAALRYEDGDFNAATHVDLTAREKWFYQAIGASPAMFRRDTKAGSLYWLGHHDSTGAPLDGANHYTLTVPLPVPGKLFLVGHRLRRRDPLTSPDSRRTTQRCDRPVRIEGPRR